MAKNLESLKPVQERGSNVFKLTNWDSPATTLLREAERQALSFAAATAAR